MAKTNSPKHNVELVISKYAKTLVPQADSMTKIATAIEVMLHSPINEKDLSSGFSMDKRQADYYADAMRFIGVVDSFEYNGQNIIMLSKDAQKYFGKSKGRALEVKLASWLVEFKIIEVFEKRLPEETNGGTTIRRNKSLVAWKKFIAERGK